MGADNTTNASVQKLRKKKQKEKVKNNLSGYYREKLFASQGVVIFLSMKVQVFTYCVT